MLIFNSRGSMLIQAMVAVGISSLIALAIATALTDGFRGQKALQVKSNLKQLHQLLSLQMLSEDLCTTALKGQTIPSATNTTVDAVHIKDPIDPDITWLKGGVSMDGFTLQHVKFETWTPMKYGYGLTNLVLYPVISEPGSVLGPSQLKPLFIPIIVLEDSANPGRLLRCGSDKSPTYLCLLEGGSMTKLWNSLSAHERCFRPGDLSGNVVLSQNQAGAIIKCQYADADEDTSLDMSSSNSAYCSNTTKMPCCRRGFKRSRLGSMSYASGTETTFACQFIGPDKCHEPGLNGCECN